MTAAYIYAYISEMISVSWWQWAKIAVSWLPLQTFNQGKKTKNRTSVQSRPPPSSTVRALLSQTSFPPTVKLLFFYEPPELSVSAPTAVVWLEKHKHFNLFWKQRWRVDVSNNQEQEQETRARV